MKRSASAFAVLALVLAVCGCDVGLPGQVSYLSGLTVLNRTTAEITVESGTEFLFTVPACAEATQERFPINWWTVTSPGRDTFHSGGGDSGPHSYLVVTTVVAQLDQRPNPLPGCEGLLQPASSVCPDTAMPTVASEPPRASSDPTIGPQFC
jgi:hypothetical protein